MIAVAFAAVALAGDVAAWKEKLEEHEKKSQKEKDTGAWHGIMSILLWRVGDMDRAADEALLGRLAGEVNVWDFAAVNLALAGEAKARYEQAMKSLDAKDLKAAAQAYLQAVKRDVTVLGRDDRGLRATAFEALKKSALKTPDFPHRWKLALYAYLFGELKTASDELKAIAGAAPVEMKWRAGMLSAKVDAEIAQARAEEAKLRAAPAPRPAAARDAEDSLPDVSPSADAGPAPDPNASRRTELQNEIDKADRLIQYYSNPDGYKYNIDDSGDSRVIKYSSSGPRLQEKIESLKAKKAALELELSNLR